MLRTPKDYRHEAEECMRLAQPMGGTEGQKLLIEMADLLNKLAERRERFEYLRHDHLRPLAT